MVLERGWKRPWEVSSHPTQVTRLQWWTLCSFSCQATLVFCLDCHLEVFFPMHNPNFLSCAWNPLNKSQLKCISLKKIIKKSNVSTRKMFPWLICSWSSLMSLTWVRNSFSFTKTPLRGKFAIHSRETPDWNSLTRFGHRNLLAQIQNKFRRRKYRQCGGAQSKHRKKIRIILHLFNTIKFKFTWA